MAKKLKDLGKVDFEDEVQKRFEKVYVPNWFTADSRTGMLNVRLDASDATSAWVIARDIELTDDDADETRCIIIAFFIYLFLVWY
jgi:hypothetical protein